jgi:ketosteroid isomerase-like protein
VSRTANLQIAEQFLKLMAEQASPDRIADMFDHDLVFEIPGDDGALPWIGRKSGRRSIVDFITGLRALTEPQKMDVRDVLASDGRAVILADVVTKVKATGKTIDSATAIVLEISDGKIQRFLMIEDSFDVSRKARS